MECYASAFCVRLLDCPGVLYTQISVLRNTDAKKRDTNGLLPYKFVWEEVPPILYGADTLLYDPLALFEGKGTFVYQVVDSLAILATSVVLVHHVSIQHTVL